MMNRSCLVHSYSNSSEGVCLSRTHVCIGLFIKLLSPLPRRLRGEVAGKNVRSFSIVLLLRRGCILALAQRPVPRRCKQCICYLLCDLGQMTIIGVCWCLLRSSRQDRNDFLDAPQAPRHTKERQHCSRDTEAEQEMARGAVAIKHEAQDRNERK